MSVLSLTYDELAERRRISPAAARNLVRRKRWSRSVGNDGKTRISVPEAELDAPINTPADAPIEGGTDGAISGGIDALSPVHLLVARLEVEVAGLKEVISSERRRADAAERDRDSWKEMAQRSWWRRLVG